MHSVRHGNSWYRLVFTTAAGARRLAEVSSYSQSTNTASAAAVTAPPPAVTAPPPAVTAPPPAVTAPPPAVAQ